MYTWSHKDLSYAERFRKYNSFWVLQEVDTNGDEEDPLSPESRHLVSL